MSRISTVLCWIIGNCGQTGSLPPMGKIDWTIHEWSYVKPVPWQMNWLIFGDLRQRMSMFSRRMFDSPPGDAMIVVFSTCFAWFSTILLLGSRPKRTIHNYTNLRQPKQPRVWKLYHTVRGITEAPKPVPWQMNWLASFALLFC